MSKRQRLFYKMSFMSFIVVLPLCFILGWLHYKISQSDVSYLRYKAMPITFTGIIINRENTIKNIVLSIEPTTISDNDSGEVIYNPPYYLQIPVSMFQEYELYESVTGKAETAPLREQHVSDKQKLFYRYETETFLQGAAIYVSSYSVELAATQTQLTTYQTLRKNLYDLRVSFIKVLETYMPEPYSSIGSGVTFGETSRLSKELQDVFKDSGLIHLMVLSGSNISFIIGLAWILSRGVSRRGRVLSVLTLAWIFVLMTGLAAPAVRAVFMASLAIWAEASGRPKAVVRALVLALGLETMLDPQALVHSASLHLSFLACFGLFIITPSLVQMVSRGEKGSGKLLQIFALMIAITLSTSVYILALSGRVNLFSGLLTLLSEPMVAISTILTFLMIISNYIFAPLSALLGFVNSYLLSLFLKLAEFGASSLSPVNFSISREQVFIYYFLLITFFTWYYLRNKKPSTYTNQENISRYGAKLER